MKYATSFLLAVLALHIMDFPVLIYLFAGILSLSSLCINNQHQIQSWFIYVHVFISASAHCLLDSLHVIKLSNKVDGGKICSVRS